MWDKDKAAKYDAWYDTPAGSFALGREVRLVEHMTSGWPRRGQRLLEIGCGTGIFLQALHRAGFEVTGLDKSPAMLEVARKRLGNVADFHLGDAEHLPFDDKEFDFTVMLTVLEFCCDPALAVTEAARVSRKGFLIGFLNKWSLYHLSVLAFPGAYGGALRSARWFSPWDLGRIIRENLGRRPYKIGSVLPGPRFTWRYQAPWRQLNYPILPLPLGGYCALRVNLLKEPVRTPLHAWTAKPEAS